MDTKGGRYTLEINGRVFSGRAAATISPARATRTNAPNMDGTGYSSVESKLAKLELEFDRGTGLKWDETMMLQEVNVTFVETDAGRTHLFTRARWSGEPQLSTENGGVTGLSLETDRYQVN